MSQTHTDVMIHKLEGEPVVDLIEVGDVTTLTTGGTSGGTENKRHPYS